MRRVRGVNDLVRLTDDSKCLTERALHLWVEEHFWFLDEYDRPLFTTLLEGLEDGQHDGVLDTFAHLGCADGEPAFFDAHLEVLVEVH